MQKHAEGNVVAAVDQVDDPLGSDLQSKQLRCPPVGVLYPDHPVLAVGVIQVCTRANGILVRPGCDFFFCPVFPEMLGDDRVEVQVA